MKYALLITLTLLVLIGCSPLTPPSAHNIVINDINNQLNILDTPQFVTWQNNNFINVSAGEYFLITNLEFINTGTSQDELINITFYFNHATMNETSTNAAFIIPAHQNYYYTAVHLINANNTQNDFSMTVENDGGLTPQNSNITLMPSEVILIGAR